MSGGAPRSGAARSQEWRYTVITTWTVPSWDQVKGEYERLRALAVDFVRRDGEAPENSLEPITGEEAYHAQSAEYRKRQAQYYATNRGAALANQERYNATPGGRLAWLRAALRDKYGTDDAAAFSIADRCRLAAALRAKAAADGGPTLVAVAEIAALETAIFVPILVYIDFAGRVYLPPPPRPYPIRFDPTADSDFLCFACGTAIAPVGLTRERTQHFSCPRCHRAAVPPPSNQCPICGKPFDDHYKLRQHLSSFHTRFDRERHDI